MPPALPQGDVGGIVVSGDNKMSFVKRFLEDQMVEMGKEEVDEEVMEAAQAKWDRLLAENRTEPSLSVKVWLSYDVGAGGQVNFHRFYQEGHSIKCKWTAFIRGMEHGGEYIRKLRPDNKLSWTIVEDSDTRKIVKYNDRYISHTVFQLVDMDVVGLEGVAQLLAARGESGGAYCTLGECIALGQHLTECDEDGYCNFCGEQD